MPRVLHLCEFPSLNGGEYSLLAVLPRLRARGIEPLVAAPRRGPLAERLVKLGIPHRAWEVRDAAGVRRPVEELRTDLRRLIAETRPEWVHANSLSMSRLVGPLAPESSVPCVGHLRDIVKLSAAAIADLNRLARLIAVSHATRAWHVAQGLEAERCVVAYNGVDLDRFRPVPGEGTLHREFNIPGGDRLLLAVGQLGPRKGFDLLLAACREVFAEQADVRLLIAGERHSEKAESRRFEEDLHAAAAEYPLVGRVHFLGRRADLPRLLQGCFALVHPARQEPLGRVLLEGAAAGRPILATAVGGTEEIFPPGSRSALLVPPTAASLAAALRELLATPALASELGRAARRRAEEEFSCEQGAARLAAVFESLLEE